MTFTISTEDPEEAKRLAKASDMAIVLFEIQSNLRRTVENFNPEASEDFHIGAQAVMDRIDHILCEHNISIDDIIS